jgi:hypothetical protein
MSKKIVAIALASFILLSGVAFASLPGNNQGGNVQAEGQAIDGLSSTDSDEWSVGVNGTSAYDRHITATEDAVYMSTGQRFYKISDGEVDWMNNYSSNGMEVGTGDFIVEDGMVFYSVLNMSGQDEWSLVGANTTDGDVNITSTYGGLMGERLIDGDIYYSAQTSDFTRRYDISENTSEVVGGESNYFYMMGATEGKYIYGLNGSSYPRDISWYNTNTDEYTVSDTKGTGFYFKGGSSLDDVALYSHPTAEQNIIAMNLTSGTVEWNQSVNHLNDGSNVDNMYTTYGPDGDIYFADTSYSENETYYGRWDPVSNNTVWTLSAQQVNDSMGDAYNFIETSPIQPVVEEDGTMHVYNHQYFYFEISPNGTIEESFQMSDSGIDGSWLSHTQPATRDTPNETLYFAYSNVNTSQTGYDGQVVAINVDDGHWRTSPTDGVSQRSVMASAPPENNTTDTPASTGGTSNLVLPSFVGTLGPVPFWVLGAGGLLGVGGIVLYMRRQDMMYIE